MLIASNISVVFTTKKLFEGVNIQFNDGNCYGVIGANGAGKSTFLQVLSGDYESTSGEVIIGKGERLSVLKQDHFQYDDCTVRDTVVMGHKDLYEVQRKINELYAKADFTDEDGFKVADLQEQFAIMNGWEAESEADRLLNGLSLEVSDYSTLMKDLTGGDKVKVLLAQALFGSPDILILDEPTNHLDFYAIKWLENFLLDFDKTVIVVSHDRHFLNNVCTHIVDIDFSEARLFVGNYDFWRESSELAQSMLSNQNAKKEEKVKQLEDFIARFSAGTRSSQATSRKKMLDKITIDDIKPSSRRYPFIHLPVRRELGKDLIKVEGLTYAEKDEVILNNLNFEIFGNEKVAVVSKNEKSITALFDVLAGEAKDYTGDVTFGLTVEKDYFPKDYSKYFSEGNTNLVDWLRAYSGEEQGESYVRGFLGKMLFSGEEPLKNVKVLSGGEKMRMMFSKLMLSEANFLILDQPTNHLDLESIHSVNEAMKKFEGALFFSSHDFSFIETIATKVLTLTPNGAVMFEGDFEEYLSDERVQARIKEMEKEA